MTAAATRVLSNSGSVLFVDDESHILKSLRRFSKRLGYRTFIANGGAEGLQVLSDNDIDVVVSDMRMPQMTGAEFLEKAATQWPHTIRILLTGYSDIDSAVAAINCGHIFRYLSKPWDDNGLNAALEQAMEIRFLAKEKARLEVLTQRQNEELTKLNASLESKVARRTAQVEKGAALLAKANKELKEGYTATVQVFASLLQSASRSAEGIRELANYARDVAAHLELGESDCEHVHLAGLLCELGKLALPDEVVTRPYASLGRVEAKEFQRHPAISESVLLPLKPLEPVARILRHHCESWNGKGYPDGLSGSDIPIASRILAVVKDFSALTKGLLLPEELTAAEALEYVSRNAGTSYDETVVCAFRAVLKASSERTSDLSEMRLTPRNLEPGMIISRDLFNAHGVLVLPKGTELNEDTINKLRRIADEAKTTLIVHVSPSEVRDESTTSCG